MRRLKSPILASSLLLLFAWGCGGPPNSALQAARKAVSKVEGPEAREYAPEELTAAREALDAAEDELTVQRGRFPLLRSYEKAAVLLQSAREKAAAVPAAIAAGKAARKNPSLR